MTVKQKYPFFKENLESIARELNLVMNTEYSVKLSKNNFNSNRLLLNLHSNNNNILTDDNLDYIKNKLKLSEIPCSKDAEVSSFIMGFDFDNDLYKIYYFLPSTTSFKGFQVKNNSISSYRTYIPFVGSGYKKYRFLDKYDKFFELHKFKIIFLRMNDYDAHSLHFVNQGRFDMANIGKPIENFCDCHQWDKANITDFLKKTKFMDINMLSFSSDEIYIYYK